MCLSRVAIFFLARALRASCQMLAHCSRERVGLGFRWRLLPSRLGREAQERLGGEFLELGTRLARMCACPMLPPLFPDTLGKSTQW